MENRPQLIQAIEDVFKPGFRIHPAPIEKVEPVYSVMRYKKGMPKYAFKDEKLIGLNLAQTGMSLSQWNAILEIPEFKLSDLHALNLSGNDLPELILPDNMQLLRFLDLSETGINKLNLRSQMDSLEFIALNGNPDLSAPPPEIVSQGSAATIAWYDSFKDEVPDSGQYLKEIKVLLVGEGLAGKTSLLKQLKGLDFSDAESQTHGVNVEALSLQSFPLFEGETELKDVKARFWDFGGQEIMHASHQFFLTHRSVYLFVLDSRTDNKKEYWLRHIQKFGGDSPAIVAINKIDENPSYSLEESSLNKTFPFINNRFVKVSCKTGAGLEQLAGILSETILQSPLFKTPISKSWLNIKNQLEEETKANEYISRDRFLAICNEYGEDDKEGQNTLLNYLNALGVVLHFPKLPLLDFFILDPHWVTIGIYKIINSPSIIDGMLKFEKLEFILNKEVQKKEEYDPFEERQISYTTSEQQYLVSIMKDFDLLYEYMSGQYLIPNLLPKEPRLPVAFEQGVDSLIFIMDYDFLPANVISRFIIHMKADIYSIDNLWRYGLVLRNSNYDCTAIVSSESSKQRITIKVNGSGQRKREYFSVIRHQIWKINKEFEDLEVKEMIPVPGHPEIELDYQELLGLEKMGEDKHSIGRLGKVFSISRDFLDKISTKKERDQGVAKHDIRDQLDRIEFGVQNTEINTLAILSNQELQQDYLESLLQYAVKHEDTLNSFFKQLNQIEIDNKDLSRVNLLLEEQLNKFFLQVPSSDEIVQKWKESMRKQPHDLDAKWKIKFQLPFLFGNIEKELSWDAKAALKMLRTELTSFAKGEKSFKELFIEEEED